MKSFASKVAVVTGAASGIGRALAEQLASEHANLALVDIQPETLEETATLARQHGVSVSTHVVDVSDLDAMRRLESAVLNEHSQVDVLINNAGVTTEATFAEQSLEDIRWVIDVNMWGVTYGTKLFLPHLLARPEAALVNVSSLFGLLGVPTQSAYCMSKFAVRGLTETLWEELAHTSVTATLVHPGGVDTNIMRDARYYHPSSREKLVKFFAEHTLPAEKCAAIILDAVRKKALRVIVAPAEVQALMAPMAPSHRHPLVAVMTAEMGIEFEDR